MILNLILWSLLYGVISAVIVYFVMRCTQRYNAKELYNILEETKRLLAIKLEERKHDIQTTSK